MRIGLAQWRQESNTFNPVATTLADYRRFGLCAQPHEIRRCYGETDELGGFFAGLAARRDLTVLPLLRAAAWSGGPLTAEAYGRLLAQLVEACREARPLDGLLLSLHGATVATGVDDVAGEAARAVRQTVGRGCRLVVTLDLHANVTASLLRTADLVVGYQTTPHIDVLETGQRAAGRCCSCWPKRSSRSPRCGACRRSTGWNGNRPRPGRWPNWPPTCAPPGPRGVSAGQPLPGPPWLDVPQLASSVVVATDRDPAGANAWRTSSPTASGRCGTPWANGAGHLTAWPSKWPPWTGARW